MRAGKVAGVQLILNNWFLVLVVMFSIVGLGFKVLGVFASVLWHELAHVATAVCLGYKVKEIELLPFGGVARIDNLGEAGAASEIAVAAAGPAASLAMVGLLVWAKARLPEWGLMLEFLLQVNLVLFLFNLMPGLPLDGGRIVRALIGLKRDFQTATRLTANLGKATCVILLMLTAADFLRTGTFNLSFIVAAVFLYVCAKKEIATAGFRSMRVLTRKKAELTAKGIMPTAHFTALATTRVRDIIRLFGPEVYYIVLVVDTGFRLQGTLTETEVWESLPARGLYAKIGDFL